MLRFWRLGIAGQADLIVSGDKKDMLALDHIGDIPIVTPREAVTRLSQNQDEED